MAITYKSQGAGVATEASGGALSPLCPATVDAGDVLIAHCGYEGTATTPSTPSGWTLLSGPHTIESAHRHWIFGKVAAGTEDGAAVAFGTPAVTTMRTARVYSFAGRTAGTITELVNGFAHLSHATDPQMPTVSTTETGNLAVACVFQLDDNATASATGESGGDWVEAVAEYVQLATTPDSGLSIQTCTPTSNPGTVSGGSIATANDPCGVIGFQIRIKASQLVTPTTLALVTSLFAPTVSAPRLVTPGTVALVTSLFAPSVGIGTTLTPTTLALATSLFAPTVSAPRLVTPTTAALVTSLFAPTVSAPRLVTPVTAALVTSLFAPTVSTPRLVTPVTAALVTATFAPTVLAPRLITPTTLALVTSLFAPTVSAPRLVTPTTLALVTSLFAPTVTASGGGAPQLVTPSTLALILATYAPTVTFTETPVVPPTPEVVHGGAGGYYYEQALRGPSISEMLKRNKRRKMRQNKLLAKVLAMLDQADEI